MPTDTAGFATAGETLAYFRVPVITTAAGVLISIFLFMWGIQSGLTRLKTDFEKSAIFESKALATQLGQHVVHAELLRSFFDVSDFVSEEEFAEYVRPLFADPAYDYVAWIRYRPDKTYETAYVVGTKTPALIDAYLPALDSLAYTGIVAYDTPKGGTATLIIMLPVDKGAGLQGLMTVALNLRLLIDETLTRQMHQVHAYVYDSADLEVPLYRLRPVDTKADFYRNQLAEADDYRTAKRYAIHHVQQSITVLNRNWQILFIPTSGYFSGAAAYASWLVLLLALLITGLLGYSAFRYASDNLRITQEVKRQTGVINEGQRRLRESEERYDVAVRGSSVGLWDWNLKTNQLYWSERLKEIVGIDDDQFIPHFEEFERLLHPDYLDTVQRTVERHLTDREPYDIEYQLMHRAGHYVWIHACGQAVWDEHGNATRMAGSAQDISGRKKSEEQLRDAYGFQKLVFDTNPLLLFVKDIAFKIVDANQHFINLYPQAMRDKVVGYTTLENYSEEDRQVFLEMDRKAFQEGYSRVEETFTSPNGKVKTYDTQKIRFHNTRGDPFILGVALDISQREALIQKLTASNEELERFAYICSHDLQEPLRMIRSFSEKLLRHMGEKLEDDTKASRYFGYVTDGATRAQKLIADILTYASVDRDTQKPERVELNELIDVAKSNLQANLEKNGGRITCDALPEVVGHKTQLYQLLSNLISNALKYQRTDVRPEVHIGVCDLSSHWQIAVNDNGIGMDNRHLVKIFEVFQRLHHKEEYTGTGIGLSICKKVAERHGGKIWVESEKGVGSTFYFTLLKSFRLPADSLGGAER